MDLQSRIDLIKRPPAEEVIVESDLKSLLEGQQRPRHYIGFEISGYLHLGTILMSGFKINDMAKAGVDCKVYLADWHSFINNKLGGDWEAIKKAAKYFEEGFNFMCPKAKVVLGSDVYHNNDDYWRDVVKFSKNVTLARNTRCISIMGRSESEAQDFAQYMYPPMQGVDIKYLGPDLPHGGMDQRKIHVLAREVFPKLGWRKPTCVHHHLLMGLAEPSKAEGDDKAARVEAAKMSKSKPWTAIFIHDSEDQIRDKLAKAWCPAKEVEMNPVMELVKYVIFHEREEFTIERPAKFGGDVEYAGYESLERDYVAGKIHPQDLKSSVARDIDRIVAPIRKHFEKPANSRLMKVFEESGITR